MQGLRIKQLFGLGGFLAVLTLAGCSCQDNAGQQGSAKTPAAVSSELRLAAEPAGGKNVLDVRKESKDGDAVVMIGRIGGSTKPFVDGRAAFTIVDPSFKPCSERGDDGCTTPWDYCCDPADELAKGTAMVKFVDAAGKTVAQDAKTLLGVKPLQTVVVRGKVKRDAEGNLVVLAEGLFVRP